MTIGKFMLLCAGSAVVTALIMTAFIGVQGSPADAGPLPVLGEAPEFELTDSRNETFTRDNVAGDIWVASFFFTTCQDPCPELTAQKARLHREFSGADGVRFVSISVNPEHDTPEVLAAYAEAYEADTSIWHFLTGPIERIHELAVEGFHLGSMDHPVFHSTRFVLVDPANKVRGYYDGTDNEAMAQLRRDITRLR